MNASALRASLAIACCLFTAAVSTGVHAQRGPQVRVELSADRTELTTQDHVTLRVYVQAQGPGQPDIEVPEFEGFQIVQRALQRPTQVSWGSGNAIPVVTSTVQYTFVAVPMGAGTFKIPPVKVSFGQRVFQSKALVLTVTDPSGATSLTGQPAQGQPNPSAAAANGGAAQANETPAAQASADAFVYDGQAFLRTVVDKLEPYEGEQVTATIYLYTRQALQQAPAVQTEASSDGFWVQSLLDPARSLDPTRQVVRGRGYMVYTLRRFAAFPLRSGELTVGSMALTLTRDGLFALFDPNGGGASDVQRRSVPVLLHAKPLPAENRPSGPVAIGKFELKAALDRAQVATGDAVTLTATIQGSGNLRAVKLADPVVKGLQILQPELRDLTQAPGDRVQSTRTFAWLVVPQAPGRYELPVLTLDTFDPATGTYRRIASERLTLTAAGAAVAGAGAAGTKGDKTPGDVAAREASEEREEAWPPLHTQSALARPQAAFASRPFYPLLLLLWPLLWAAFALGPSTLARLRARGAGTAEQAALRTARKRLTEAQRALAATDARKFHSDIAAALSTALEVRLGESIAGLTQNALRARLADDGLPEALNREVCEILAQCDFARFSSAQVGSADMQPLLVRAERVWAEVARFAAPTAAAAAVKGNA